MIHQRTGSYKVWRNLRTLRTSSPPSCIYDSHRRKNDANASAWEPSFAGKVVGGGKGGKVSMKVGSGRGGRDEVEVAKRMAEIGGDEASQTWSE